MSDPLVSVVMPVFNAELYLREAIESVLSQTLKELEFIIIDDGSVDDTCSIVQKYAEKDSRIKLLKNDLNRGLPYTLNRGLDAASAPFIARMDGDDLCYSDRLEKQLAAFESDERLAMCGSWVQFFGEKNNLREMETEHDELKLRMLLEYPFEHPSLMFRASVLKQNQIRYDERLALAEDLDISIRVAACGKVTNLATPLLKLRQHSQRTHKTMPEVLERGVRIVISNQLEALAIEANEKNVNLHYRIRENALAQSGEDFNQVTQWLQKILRQNRLKKVYHEAKLERYLLRRWEDWLRSSAQETEGLGWNFLRSGWALKVKPNWIAALKLTLKLNRKL